MKKVVHLTSVHPRHDVRIFLKQCLSLSSKYSVSLIVADGLGDAKDSGIDIFDVGRPKGRLSRMASTTKKVYRKAMELKADVYQAHDPELLPVLYKLKKSGYKVIFDVHEDYELIIKSKTYIKPYASYFVTKISWFIMKLMLRKCDAIIHVHDSIRDKYSCIKNNLQVVIRNYPHVDLAEYKERQLDKVRLVYAGSISEERGFNNLLQIALNLPKNYELHIAGRFSNVDLQEKFNSNFNIGNVFFHGYLNEDDLFCLYAKCHIGLIPFENIGQYGLASSIKLYEYLQHFLYVLVPNFGEWLDFIDLNRCFGRCVNYKDILSFFNAIECLFSNKNKYIENIQYSAEIVAKKYSWNNEKAKLYDLYSKII